MPTWVPGGGALAWVEYGGDKLGDDPGEGIWVSPVGKLADACPDRADSRLIVPGGSYPFWGPAGVADEPLPPIVPATGWRPC